MRSAGRKPKHERKVGPEERRGRGSGSARPPEQESAAWAELNIVEEGDEPEEDSEAEETEAPREKLPHLIFSTLNLIPLGSEIYCYLFPKYI